MQSLEIKFYDEAANGRVNGISIVIQLYDWAGKKEAITSISKHGKSPRSKRKDAVAAHEDLGPNRARRISAPRSPNRLLPTDRLVLKALCARVPQGEQVTRPVRLQELMEECGISRSQARICLKRLTEKGLIERLSDGVKLGSQEGYSYKISKDAL